MSGHPSTDPAGTVRSGDRGTYLRLDGPAAPWLRVDETRGPLHWAADAAVAGIPVLGAVPAACLGAALTAVDVLLHGEPLDALTADCTDDETTCPLHARTLEEISR